MFSGFGVRVQDLIFLLLFLLRLLLLLFVLLLLLVLLLVLLLLLLLLLPFRLRLQLLLLYYADDNSDDRISFIFFCKVTPIVMALFVGDHWFPLCSTLCSA